MEKREVKPIIKLLFKLLIYGIQLNYHIKKRDKFASKHKTLLNFHYEMAEHYYEKIFGERK